MKFSRVWSMPNKNTFLIPPIANLIERYVPPLGIGWVDPFAGDNSPAQFTNDLNPNVQAGTHLKADVFSEGLMGLFEGCLFDPPYSLRQTKECYKGIGIDKLTPEESRDGSFGKVKDILAKKIKPGGLSISCGWSSCGFGKKRGFGPEIVEILLVPHGGHHNDTIVTVERKL